MRVPYYHIDAFTSRRFGGNPAGVCLLEHWPADVLLQAVAAENGHSETAFLVPVGPSRHALRWFTPAIEVDLCGHATLAAAHALGQERGLLAERMEFETRSGLLSVTREDGRLVLDFPSRPPSPGTIPPTLASALGAQAREVGVARDLLVVLDSEAQVRALRPDMAALAEIDTFAVIATAPGEDCDFVSRFFAPRAGVPEDPVTGSAHCTLIPYWSRRLGKTRLFARQVSARGGELYCEDRGERVSIGGHAVTYASGFLHLA